MSSLIKKFAANMFLNGESLGGFLHIYENGLRFKSHAFNFQKADVWIDILDIQNLENFNTLFFIPNGLKVSCSTGEYDFIVWNRSKVSKLITSLSHKE